jgi:tetratricopeptide (TPR) repeat protein
MMISIVEDEAKRSEKSATDAADDSLLEDLSAEIKRQSSEPEEQTSTGRDLATAWCLLHAGDSTAAAQRFEQGFEQLPESRQPDALLGWALSCLGKQQYEPAIAALEKTISLAKSDEEKQPLYFYLAGALQLAGRTDEAVTVARTATAAGRKSPQIDSRLPWIYYNAKRYDEARREYESLLERYADSADNPAVRDEIKDAKIVLSHICGLDGDLAQAEEWLEQVLDDYPRDVGALNDLGFLWVDQGKHLDRSLRMITSAVEAEPDNSAYRDSLGWAYFRLGRYQEAVAELERAAAVPQPDPVILDHLADAYARLNDWEKARQTWRRALTAFPEGDPPKEAEAIEKKLADSAQFP